MVCMEVLALSAATDVWLCVTVGPVWFKRCFGSVLTSNQCSPHLPFLMHSFVNVQLGVRAGKQTEAEVNPQGCEAFNI